MKKFNVKALSLAVAAAVVSSAAGAVERDLGSIPEKAQNAMAFQTVFGENTKFDEDTGKFTFDKDSSALLLKTMELEQAVNGFAAGSNFVATNEDGKKIVREATNADIEADSMKGVGLAGGITAVNTRVDNLAKDIDEALDEQDQTVEQLKAAITSNNEHIAKVAGDVAEMGKEVSAKFDEVDEEITKASTELSESIEKVAGDVTAVNKRVDTLEQDTAAAKASAKAAEEKVTELSANVDSKVKEAKDAADKAVDAASKIDAVTEKADKASKGVEDLAKELEATQKATAQVALATMENAQEFNGFKEGDQIVVTKDDGSKVIRKAGPKDVAADEFKGLGLKEAVKDTQKAAAQAALAAIENAQELNGFKEGDQIVVTKEDGSKVIRTAKKEDVEADGFGGKGLNKVVAAYDETLDGLTKSVTDNKALLEAQGEANEGFNNAIASLDEDVDALKKADLTTAEALEAHKAKLEANRKDIDANKALLAEQGEANEGFNNAIASLDEDVDALKKADLTTAEALEAHKAKLEANRKDIDANKALLAEQGEANEGFNNAITSLGEDISTLKKAAEQAALASVENAQALNGFAEGDEIVVTDKDGIKSIKTATKEDVKNADFEGMGLKEVVNDISKGVTANTDAIKNKADQIAVESVKTIAVDAQKSAQAAQGAVKEAQESAKAAQASAVTANNVASAAQTAAAQAQDAFKANEARVAANKADIATLQTASSQHAAGIAKNSARIDSLDKNVANLRKETRQGLAAQAALSGLFQPYSVGKFNVTAALGGFKSDTAVAVGAGYRFNENFAAKAGLAVGTSSGGSASYNVGVNYEW